MIRNPDVTVIMPAYKAMDTIAASIRSVQSQTLQNWELIIVDDGSPDETAQMAIAAAGNDLRISVIQRCNRGPSLARNHGAGLARADVLAFLDADDLWAPQRLEGMLLSLAEKPQAGVVFSRTRFLDAVTLQQGTLTPHRAVLSAADLFAENAVCSTSNIVCRKALFEETGGFNPDLAFAEDQDWLLRVALGTDWKIMGLDEEWFFYRSSDASQSADLERMRLGWLRMVDAAHSAFPARAPRAARLAYGPLHRQLARRALRMARPAEALRYLGLAVRYNPGLLLRQPRRTALTVLGTLISFLPHRKFKELVAK
ncbi:MAG: glycosyltransferase family 2 protein [Hyphomonadaceae bacterium]|nr:glycosyltransferase family 2 protein [Hyphomonadaceae bacterium]